MHGYILIYSTRGTFQLWIFSRWVVKIFHPQYPIAGTLYEKKKERKKVVFHHEVVATDFLS